MNRKSLLIALVLILGMTLLTGCGGGGGSKEETFSFSGRVIDYDGNPLSNLTIQVDYSNMITTDENGNYTINNVRNGATISVALVGDWRFNPPFYQAFNNHTDANFYAYKISPNDLIDALSFKVISETAIEIKWSDKTALENGYRVFRKKDPGWEPGFGNLYEPIANLPANSTSYLDTNPIVGTSYSYAVSGYDSIGEDTVYRPDIIITAGVPPLPTSFTATNITQTSLKLNWSTTATNITGFKIMRYDEYTDNTIEVANLSNNQFEYTDQNLISKRTYRYTITTYNNYGSFDQLYLDVTTL